MKRLSRYLLTLALAVILVTPLAAQDKKKKKKKRGRRAFSVVRLPKSLDLTTEQKEKIAKINKEYAPKFREFFRAANTVITREQRRARREAGVAARKAGKKGRELRKAVNEAVKLTDDQKKKLAENTKKRSALFREARAKILEVLTPEQRAKVKVRPKGKKKRKKKKSSK